MKYTTGTDNALPTSSSSSSSNQNAISELQTTVTTTQQEQQSATTTTSAVNNTTAATTNPNTNQNPNPNHNPKPSHNQTDSNAHGGEAQQSATQTTASPNNALFCEQVTTVTNLFEKWNDCERTVVMYALLKRLRYPSLKFLQYSIDNNLTQNLGTCQTNLSSVVIDINANNPSYLQNLLSAYKTCQPSSDLCVLVDGMSSSSSDKDSMACYGSDFQLTSTTSQHPRKEDLLHEVLNMLPLLKPGNEEAKLSYMTLIPLAVKDTVQQLVPTELVQQIFSYMFIHPAIGSDFFL